MKNQEMLNFLILPTFVLTLLLRISVMKISTFTTFNKQIIRWC